ncbi:MAG: insulinase family protein, partial [Acidobacteria bacterium]|nr:insulinase family protein [Acidobacteriota bacterium]
MLDEGSDRRSATEIAAAMERLGGRLSTSAGWNSTYLSASLLSQDLATGLELMAELTLSPSFPEQELERLRRERLAELLQEREDSRTLASRRFAEVVFQGTPYQHPLEGDEESVATITRQEMAGFYRRYLLAGGSFLVAVGDLDPEELAEQARSLLGSAFAAPRPELPSFDVRPLETLEVHVVDRPGAAQTELFLGHDCLRRRDPDFLPLMVTNSILGGKFTSRINLNLRERHGYTYGAHSQVIGRLGPGQFLISAAVGTEVTGAAVRETVKEIRRIQEELVTEEELADTKSYLRGIFAQQLQTVDDLAFRLGTLALYELPDDYYDHYHDEIGRTDREQVREMARRYFHPERMALVAVGPASQLVPQLEDLGPVVVWDPALAGSG